METIVEILSRIEVKLDILIAKLDTYRQFTVTGSSDDYTITYEKYQPEPTGMSAKEE